MILLGDINDWIMIEKAIDFLKESLVKDELYTEPMYVTKTNPPMQILDQEEYDTLQNIILEWHMPDWAK